jgi:hypothetical protein
MRREARPWAYWWWMASAVDPTNLVAELTRYQQAGMGGVHIIPIYGAKGLRRPLYRVSQPEMDGNAPHLPSNRRSAWTLAWT